MDNLYKICQQNNFTPSLCVEVGSAHPRTTQLKEFIENKIECWLIEANPRLFYCLSKGFDEGDFQSTWPQVSNYPHQFPGFENLSNVKLFNYAIFNKNKNIKFFERNASSFCENIDSPAKICDSYRENDADSYIVEAITMDKIDTGSIDLLAIDVEGCEWFVLERLISRPKILCIETHGPNYQNKFLPEINQWAYKNLYTVVGRSESDTLFVKQ
jgi:FkbM family methyltransferase